MRARTIYMLGLWALLFACRSDEPAVDPLAGVLEAERATALAAERIGKGGGVVEVTSGHLDGVSFTVPPGALSADAVISIYGAKDADPATGYKSVGPAALVKAKGGRLVKDAIVELPFSPDLVSGPVARAVVILHSTDDVVDPLAGVFVNADQGTARGPTQAFGAFGAAVDSQYAKPLTFDSGSLRCERSSGWATLQSAIAGSRMLALGSMNDAEVFAALTVGDADGCGYSPSWMLRWYSPSLDRIETYSYATTGITGPLGVENVTCIAAPFVGSGDSDLIADDFSERLGQTPVAIKFEVLSCEAVGNPPVLRITEKASGKSADYGPNGDFQSKTF